MSAPQDRYSLEQLAQLIALQTHLLGEKPKELTVTADFYTWFVQEAQREAEILGLNPGFQDEPRFHKVLIKKKFKLETT